MRRHLRLSSRRLSKANLAPATDDPLRGAYYRWMFFAAGPVEAAVTAKSVACCRRPKNPPWSATARSIRRWRPWTTPCPRAAPAVGRPPTAADVYVGSQVSWGLMFGTIPTRPVFQAYAERLAARPGRGVRAREIDDALVAAQKKGGA